MKNFEKEVLERLDLLIKLIASSNLDSDNSQTKSIIQLNKIGIRPLQIADILRTTQNYVNMTLSKERSKKKNA